MTPAHKSGKYLIGKSSDLFMKPPISIFDYIESDRSERIYIRGINEIIKEVFIHLGGPIKTSKILNMPYSKTKEWTSGRGPISLHDLNLLLSFCGPTFEEKIRTKIDSTDLLLNCKYSQRKIKFPKRISPDLAYIIGLILGDGTLAGDSSNQRGNWKIDTYFDNLEHHKLYDKLIMEEFGFSPNFYDPNKGHTVSGFSSKVLHWFFREYFEFHNGYKCNKIFVPNKILNCENNSIIAALLQGLFDSDETFTCNEARYSTTSEKMALQVKKLLELFDIDASIGVWVKKGGYLPLYTVYLCSRAKIESFEKHIGFRHPNKKLLLAKFLDSPMV